MNQGLVLQSIIESNGSHLALSSHVLKMGGFDVLYLGHHLRN